MSRVLPLLALALLLSCRVAHAQASQVIAVGYYDAGYPAAPELEALMREAYARIGMKVEFKHLPLLRELEDVNCLEADATLFRSPKAIRHYPNLQMVNVPILSVSFAAVSLEPGMGIHSAADLKNHTIGILKGDNVQYEPLEASGIKFKTCATMAMGFDMLERGRLDAILLPVTLAPNLAKTYGHETVELSPPLFHVKLYHAVNQKHLWMIPKLEAALLSMHRDGSCHRLAGRFENLLAPLPAMDNTPAETMTER